MQLENIPADIWQSFIDEFNRKYNNQSVKVISYKKDIGNKIIAENNNLKEITISSEPGEFNNTAFVIVDGDDGEITQVLDKVRSINMNKGDEGNSNVLELISDLDETLIIEFNSKENS